MEKMTRGQIQDLVGKFASENPKYRAALLSNPKGTIEKQLNTTLGAVTVKAVADTADTVHVDRFPTRPPRASCRMRISSASPVASRTSRRTAWCSAARRSRTPSCS